MRATGARGIVDLSIDPRWACEMEPKKDWSLEWVAEKTDKGTKAHMTIGHKGAELVLDQNTLMEITANCLQVMFLAADIPNEAIPEPLRGHLAVAATWAQAQAQGLMAFMIQTMTGMIHTPDGKSWKVDWAYLPNISSSNIIGLDGSKPQTWDGSFRPVMQMTEVVMPRYTGENHDPQRRDDPDSQAAGKQPQQAG